MENEFPSNSHRKEQPAGTARRTKNVQRITTSKVTMRKKTLSEKFMDLFGRGEFKRVVHAVLTDVAAPRMKDLISDAISTGTDKLLYQDQMPPSRSRGRGSVFGAGLAHYQGMGRPAGAGRREDPRSQPRASVRDHRDLNQVVLGSRPEANEVLEHMFDILSEFEVVSVRDLLDMVGEPGKPTDENWGWEDLRGSTVKGTRDGYLLLLPPAKPID